MKKLNVGIVGLGLGQRHAASCAELDCVGRLVVCDLDAKRLEAAQRALPKVAATYQDIAQMLQSESLDAVSVVTPDDLHRPHAEAALHAGCHVMVTKPIATRPDDARAMIRLAEAQGRKLMVAHERRYRARYKRIRELIESGALGGLILVRMDTIQNKRQQFERSPWYASASAGRSALVGTGIHCVDMVRHLVAKPIESVCAYGNRFGDLKFPADKTTAALFRFEGGVIGEVTVTYEARPALTGDYFFLVGTKGTIMDDRASYGGHEGVETLPPDDQGLRASTSECMERFLQCIIDDRPIPITGRDGFASLAACLAADESAATGKPAVPAPADFI